MLKSLTKIKLLFLSFRIFRYTHLQNKNENYSAFFVIRRSLVAQKKAEVNGKNNHFSSFHIVLHKRNLPNITLFIA